MDMELVFYRTFQLAGLTAPKMCTEIPVGAWEAPCPGARDGLATTPV
jgi:hypothetical protein